MLRSGLAARRGVLLATAATSLAISVTAAGAALALADRPSPPPPAALRAPSTPATPPAPSSRRDPSTAPVPSATPTSPERAAAAPPAPSTPAATSGDLVAARGTATIDGDTREWEDVPARRSAAVVAGRDTGVAASWRVRWDDRALYLLAEVSDPGVVQPFLRRPGQLYRGDAVHLELGPDARRLSNRAGLRAKDGHYLFGPKTGGGLVTAVNRRRDGIFDDGGADGRIRAVERQVSGGYRVEISIPWQVVGVDPGAGATLAANLNVSDGSLKGTLRAMKSTNPRRSGSNQNLPGTWQTLRLG